MSEWIVLYDPDCGFCRWCVGVLLRADRARRLAPLALGTPEANTRLADLTPDERMASWHLIAPNGRRDSSGAGLITVLGLLRGGRIPGALLARSPRLAEWGYGWVAGHRGPLGRLLPSAAKRRADARIEARRAGRG